MLTSLLITLAFLISSANAAPSCADLQTAFKADQMNVTEATCVSAECKAKSLEQLRITVNHFTGSRIADAKHSLQLNADYDPRFYLYSVGTEQFDAVNIELQGHALVALFDKGTNRLAGIHMVSGRVYVSNQICQTKFKPVVTTERRRNVCASLIPALQQKRPQLVYDLSACEGSDPNNRLDVFIEDFNETSMKLRVQRRLDQFGGGYFACDVYMDRRDSTVQSLNCMVL